MRSSLWAAPAIAVAAAAPAYATSPQSVVTCTAASWESALYARVEFTGLTSQNQWSPVWSEATISLRIGRRVGDTATSANDPALGFTSTATGLTVSVTSYSFEVTLPYVVDWTSRPTGWTVTLVSGTTYRFTPAASIVTTVLVPHTSSPETTGPGVSVPASGLFRATVPSRNFTNGQKVKTQTYSFSPRYRATYTTSGATCAPRTTNAAWDTTLNITPA